MSYDSEVAADSPVGYWKFQEASGTTAADAGSGSHSGTVTGSITVNASSALPAIGKAYTGAGADNAYVDFGDVHTFAGSTAMSVEAWVKPSGASASGRILAKEKSGSPYAGWVFALSGGYLYYARNSGSGGTYKDLTGTTALSSGTWYHVVATYDPSTSPYFKLYVNGTLESGATAGGSLATPYSIGTTANPLRAFVPSDTGTAAKLSASLSRLAVYDSTLSAARVLAHYNAGIGIAATDSASVSDTASVSSSVTVSASDSASVSDSGSVSAVSIAASDTATATDGTFGNYGFTAADGTLLTSLGFAAVSAYWTSDLRVTSNRVRAYISSGVASARVRSTISRTDGYTQADFTRVGSYLPSYGGYGELDLRLTDANNFYQAVLDNGDNVGPGKLQLYKVVGGVQTLLASYDNGGAWPSTVTMKFDATGTALKVWVDGVLCISTTDSSLASSGYSGLSLNAQEAAVGVYGTVADNWLYGQGVLVEVVPNAVTASDSATATDSASVSSSATPVAASDSAAATDSSALLALVGGGTGAPLSGWSSRKPVIVTGTSIARSQYPIAVTLLYTSGMKANFDDVRFTTFDGTLLTYWRESYTASTTAKFWVVMDTPATGVSTTILAHYGNAGASYAGATWGANALFGSLDGGSGAGTLPQPASGPMAKSSSGWDDRFVYYPRWVLNLDGTIYEDGSGYKYLVYTGASVSSGVYGSDDDRPGLFKTLDFSTYTRVTTSDALLRWGAGTWDPTGASYYDSRVIQAFTIYYTGSQFVMFFDGDRGPAHVVENYTQNVATASNVEGPYTKSASNPVFASGHSYASGYNDGNAFGGDIFYDADEADSNKRWKNYYQGQNSGTNKWGVMLATAPSPTGPWTRYSTSYIFQPMTGTGAYDGGISRVFRVRGIWYMIWERYTDWTSHLAMSLDGISWTDRGQIFARGSAGTFNATVSFWLNMAPLASDTSWRVATSGGLAGAYTIGTSAPTLNPPPGAWDPTVSVSTGLGDETITATDTGSVTVGVGVIAKTASDSASATETTQYTPPSQDTPSAVAVERRLRATRRRRRGGEW